MSQLIKTKFELGKERRIPELMVKVNGIEVMLHIDIGAKSVIINRSFAENELNLEYSEKTHDAKAVGNNTVKVNFSKADLSIAGKEFNDFEVGVMDMSLLGDANGVIGFQLLKDFRVVLDYKNLEFSLETSEEDPDMQPLEFMMQYLIKIPATVRGKQLNFVLDSGASVNVFSKNTMDKLNWEYHKAPDSSEQVEGIGGKVNTWGMLISSVNIWSNEIDISGSLSPVIELPDQYEGGILGYPILKDKILTIDYPKKRISLKNLK